jgi:hypothetical protein
MRTYTNFDLWKTYVHHRGLGKFEYKGECIDLDNESELLTLLAELHLEGVVTISQQRIVDPDGQIHDKDRLLSYRLNGALQGMNTLRDGQENNMQLGTVMLNLVEAGVLKRVSR